MFSQSLTNPVVLPVFSPNNDDKRVPSSIIRMKYVSDNFQKAKTPGQDDKCILISEKTVNFLLELLCLSASK